MVSEDSISYVKENDGRESLSIVLEDSISKVMENEVEGLLMVSDDSTSYVKVNKEAGRVL